jgi:aminotransferase/cystathionine beta-lyase
MPAVKVYDLEGTYLNWMDFRGLGLGRNELEDYAQLNAKVLFDEGYIFGDEGDGFERINLACPRPILDTALTRLKQAAPV